MAAYANANPQVAASWSANLTNWGKCICRSLLAYAYIIAQEVETRIRMNFTSLARALTQRAIRSAETCPRIPTESIDWQSNRLESLSQQRLLTPTL